ncbi:MAG: DUF6443 domain-containing protein [Mucilaginibacter sp.]|uniref:DUF6443 domain-containing protein n=1 Tax=Mucilaginibacter sp. TaxID=1882438 RepID=UPI0031B311CB
MKRFLLTVSGSRMYIRNILRQAAITGIPLLLMLLCQLRIHAQVHTNSAPGGGSNAPGPLTPIAGQASVLQGSSYPYHTIGGEGATDFNWFLIPANAGTINAVFGSAQIAWSATYSGPVVIGCKATNSYGASTSAPLTVHVYAPLVSGDISPVTQKAFSGGSTQTLTAAAATGGDGNYSYKWQSSANGSGWSDVGVSSLNYNPGELTATTYYHLVTTSTGTAVASNTATVTVYPQLVSGNISPANQTISYGGAGTLQGAAATGGDGSYSYNWQWSPNGSSGWQDVTPAVNALEYKPANLTSTTYYHMITTDMGANVTSNVVVVTVNPPPAVVPGAYIQGSQTIAYNGTASLSIGPASGGTGTYSYQWQQSTDGGLSWPAVGTGQSFSSASLTSTTYYRVLITSGSQSATSAVATVTVNPQNPPTGGGTGGTGTCTPASTVPVLVTAPMSGAANSGEYYSYSGIILSTGFSFTATTSCDDFHAYALSPDCQPLAGSLSSDKNFIVTTIPSKSGMKQNTDLAGRSTCELMQTAQYFDGLGRLSQTIQVKGSTLGLDVVQPVVYDQFGREAVKYLPYAASGTADGKYRSSALTDQMGFYAPPSSGVATNANPYSVTGFEASPLNRVLEQGAPGLDWQLASGHTQKIVYMTNNVTAFAGSDTATSTLAAMYIATSNPNGSRTLKRGNGTDINYKAGRLYVTVSKDENWKSGRGGTTEEYKDQDGHVVLKRTFNYAGGILQMLSTYYVYDEMGNLAYVLPPGTNPDGAGIPVYTGSLGYTYRYDERNRLTQKKIPGKGWEFTIYNKLDQPVLSQDSVQRTMNQWTVTKYDAQGRVVMTGLWNAGSVKALSDLQGQIYAADQWDKADKNADVVTYSLGYRVTSYPALSKVLTVNYYDDYQFPQLPFTARIANTMAQPTGLLTGSRTAVLNTIGNTAPDMLSSVHYYDDKGREAQSYHQHYLGGVLTAGNYDVVTTSYTFLNTDSVVVRQHYTSANASVAKLTVTTSYDYDHMGRRTNSWEQIQNGGQSPDTRVLVSRSDYNEVGQVSVKHLHSTDQGGSFRQDVAYAYNERGWLLSGTSPLFNMYLYYNTGTGGKQYNGNIANQLWQTNGGATNVYTYTYDQLNRLTSGISTTGNNETGISYDAMGNIKALARYSGNVLSDQLSYTYAAGSTQLQQVTDASGSDAGQKNGTAIYTYDGNGNLNSDNSKGITSITYNLLNLPQSIAGMGMTYVYDATGRKLRRVAGLSTTDYIDGIEYDGTTSTAPALSFIQTEEGRALPNGVSAYNYEYTLTDHLGNSRVNFDTGSGVARQVQADDYYPFGMDVAIGSKPSTKNNYLYNKKELQDGVNWYDYGARFYDPVIGRWTTVDPSADEEDQESDNPYIYVANNPISRTDPDGKIWGQVIGAVVGAAVDYGTQVYANYQTNSTLPQSQRSNPWTKNINLVSIGTSALEGALTNGESAIKSVGTKLAIKVGVAAINNTLEIKTSNEGLKVNVNTDVVNVAKNATVDLVAGAVTSKIGQGAKYVGDKVGGKTINKIASKVTVSRSRVANALKSTGLNSRVRSVIGQEIREGQNVLAGEIKNVVGTVTTGVVNGKTNSSLNGLKDNTNVKP